MAPTPSWIRWDCIHSVASSSQTKANSFTTRPATPRHWPTGYITSINKSRGLQLLCLFCYSRSPHHSIRSVHSFLSTNASWLERSENQRPLCFPAGLIHHQHQHHIYKSRFSKGSLSIIYPEISAYKKNTIHKTSHKKKSRLTSYERTADGAINEITLVTKCKRQIILRIAISISPSHISKAEKREITTNTPYFEAKRWI